MYSQMVRDHFANPRNVGELEKADAIGTAKNEVDGDQVQLHLKLDNKIITDIKMKVMGCVAAIASTSMMTEIIKGKSINQAKGFSKEALNDALGGLPENKFNCSLTCIDALHQALEKIQ